MTFRVVDARKESLPLGRLHGSFRVVSDDGRTLWVEDETYQGEEKAKERCEYLARLLEATLQQGRLDKGVSLL
jgi:hypothetical protein